PPLLASDLPEAFARFASNLVRDAVELEEPPPRPGRSLRTMLALVRKPYMIQCFRSFGRRGLGRIDHPRQPLGRPRGITALASTAPPRQLPRPPRRGRREHPPPLEQPPGGLGPPRRDHVARPGQHERVSAEARAVIGLRRDVAE